MGIALRLVPIVLSAVIHTGLLAAGLTRLKQGPPYGIFCLWMFFQALWTSTHALFWATSLEGADLFVGVILPAAPASMFLFALSYPNRILRRWWWLVYLPATIAWIPSAVVGSARVTAPEFAVFQMPCMLALDLAAGVAWFAAYRREEDRILRRGALLLLLINLPAVLMAGTSYYLAYFVVRVPAYLPWFGDLVIGLGGLLSFVVLSLVLKDAGA